MLINRELALCREAFENGFLQGHIVDRANAVERAFFEHEEAAVDPAFGRLRLFAEPLDHAVAYGDLAEARRRAHRGYRGELAAGAVVHQQPIEIDVGDTVAVCREECVAGFVSERRSNARSSQRLLARLGKDDAPVLLTAISQGFDVTRLKIDRKIRIIEWVIEKEISDHITPIAEAQCEIPSTEMAVMLHDVPKNWPAADRHHGFGLEFGFLAQSGTETTAQDDDAKI